ncbi:MarR family winged helix-turn-helix transcriptional regulator [Streptomyces monticola]|uniref:MarR family winged helix-turn-helix transcriptional regulator n=1 Tax=Streptomyces monticola TaxID=2666263 RepID=A0ABW2JY34_9ACTN
MTARPEVQELRGELSRMSRRFRAQADQLHPGLSFAAYFLLARMDGEESVPFGTLVAAAGLNKSTTSRQLTELWHEGLVERDPAPEGGRAIVYRLTDAGRERLAAAESVMDEGVARQVSSWSRADIVTLARLLHRYNHPGEPEADA